MSFLAYADFPSDQPGMNWVGARVRLGKRHNYVRYSNENQARYYIQNRARLGWVRDKAGLGKQNWAGFCAKSGLGFPGWVMYQ